MKSLRNQCFQAINSPWHIELKRERFQTSFSTRKSSCVNARCTPPADGGGVLHPALDEGYPIQDHDGVYPHMILDEGTPPISRMGYPLSRHVTGYPSSAGWGTPNWTWDGVLPIQTWDGVPPPSSPASADRLKILPSLILRMRSVNMTS